MVVVAAARTLPRFFRPASFAACLTIVAGAGGMAISFLYLAATDPCDVLAGAAGFIAGSILIAGGLVSVSVQRPIARRMRATPRAATDAAAVDAAQRFAARWLAHFQRNGENRPEPDWSAPITLAGDVVRPLVRSLEQFQLGDGGGPAYLIARNRERFISAGEKTRELVDQWFAEEREHARLLGEAVSRFSGRCIRSHWSFSAFCFTRRWFGVRFELTVLLLTEIASTVYYRLLRRHGDDPALRAMCRLILRDEAGHIAFHRDRLARAPDAGYGMWWAIRFRMLGLAAATMLWINHAAGLKATGACTTEFYRDVWAELSRFIRRLRAARV